MLSDREAQTVQDICEGYTVSRETMERLKAYANDLSKWAKRINLIGPGTGQDIWSRHILDSLQLITHAPNAKTWLDFGSGAGLPGMVLAIAFDNDEERQVTLVESNRKKTAFLRTMKAQYAKRAIIRDERIETFVSSHSAPDVITARAVAPLITLFDWLAPWSDGDSVCLFPKGRGYEKELDDSAHYWRYDSTVHPSRIDPDSVVLEIRNLNRA